jgi:hypothetical protein
VKHRLHGPVVVSIALHLGVAALFAPALVNPRYFDRLFTTVEGEAAAERILFVAAQQPIPDAVADTSHAVVRAESPDEPVNEQPDVVTTTAVAANNDPGTGSPVGPGTAPRVDADDPRGVALVPGSADPRVWNTRAAYVAPVKTNAEALAGSLGRAIARANDSVAALGVQNIRPDWIVGRDGRRFGIAEDRIHLGPVTLPAIAMGLAPIPGFGCMPKMFFPDRPVRDSVGIICMQLENSAIAERAERINEMSAEIRARAPVAVAAREEIDRIAARKDRERAARLAREEASAGASINPVRPPCP